MRINALLKGTSASPWFRTRVTRLRDHCSTDWAIAPPQIWCLAWLIHSVSIVAVQGNVTGNRPRGRPPERWLTASQRTAKRDLYQGWQMHQDWLRTEIPGIPSPYRSHHQAPCLCGWHKSSKSKSQWLGQWSWNKEVRVHSKVSAIVLLGETWLNINLITQTGLNP